MADPKNTLAPTLVADRVPTVAAEPIPTVVADRVDIVYRVNGTGAGRGSATRPSTASCAGRRPNRPRVCGRCTP